MKVVLAAFPAVLALTGCALQQQSPTTNGPTSEPTVTEASSEDPCVSSTALPEHLAPYFEEIEDKALLESTLGATDKGMLCQGKVYQVKENTSVPIHRAWNSTNPHSQFGKWWAFDKPTGLTAQYRQDYEICYQWSPLDKLVSCRLNGGSKIVVGNGQSATCSEYLTYPKSAAQQVYLSDAAQQVANCDVKDAVFSWQ